MGNKKKALACYTLYLKQSPHDEDIRQKQVMLAFECGDFLLVQNVLQKNPKDDATYYHDLALVTFKLGDYKKAHDLLNKAESLSPRFSKARTLRIHLLTAQQKYDEIAQLFTTWLTESPGDAGLIKTIMKLEAKGLSRTSVHNILRSAAQEKATLPVCFALADMLHEAGEYDEARTWYDTALSVDPQEGEKKGLTSSQLHFQKACTHFRENNHQAMYNELAAAQQSSIVYPSVYNLLSFADPAAPDALALVNKALEADASNEAYLATKKSVVLTKGQ
jgi:tetratricopeptide (TPR) repeat protein